MKLFLLPQDEELYKYFKQDIARANRVIIISPYLSIETISYWRNLSSIQNSDSFTIIYDIGNEHDGVNGITGAPRVEIEKRIEWRNYDKLHAKLYYFEFKDGGYALYLGSANFTERGIGNASGRSLYNAEILSRITDADNVLSVRDIVIHFLDESKLCIPQYVNGQWIKGDIIDDFKVKEFKLILSRIYNEDVYFSVNTGFQKMSLAFFRGLFVSKNHRYLKMHTTINSKNPMFTISLQELKWFLGDFQKRHCLNSKRQLMLVIKHDGFWDGRLSIFYVRSDQLFDLLAKSTRIQKLRISKQSITLSIAEQDGAYYLQRHSNRIKLDSKQIMTLSALRPEEVVGSNTV